MTQSDSELVKNIIDIYAMEKPQLMHLYLLWPPITPSSLYAPDQPFEVFLPFW